MASELPVELKISVKTQELQSQLQQAFSKANVSIGINFQDLQSKLNEKTFTLDNIAISSQAIVNLRNQIQQGLNASPITLNAINIDQGKITQQIQQAINQANSTLGQGSNRISGAGGGFAQMIQGQPYNPINQNAIDDYYRRIAPYSNIYDNQMRMDAIGRYQQSMAPYSDINQERYRQDAIARYQQSVAPYSDIYQHQAEERARQDAILRYQQSISPYSDINEQKNRQAAIDQYNQSTAQYSSLQDRQRFLTAQKQMEMTMLSRDLSGGLSYDENHPIIANLIAKSQEDSLEGIQAQKTLMSLQDTSNSASRRMHKASLASMFMSQEDVANKFGLDIGNVPKRSFFNAERLNEGGVKRSIGLSALFGTINGNPSQLIGGTVGSAIGGGITGDEFGAQTGGAVGIAVIQGILQGLNSLKDSLISAAEAGLTFQRSVLGVTAVLSQQSEFVGANGQPLDLAQQVGLQKGRARSMQLSARNLAAQVGIGGETESSIVQAILTGAGARGISLSSDQAAILTQRFGAAMNIFAPELASTPNVSRRDITDIMTGVGQASRTAVGSRIPQVVSAIKNAKNGDELVKATDALEKLITVFQNSGDAITQIQRFNAIMEITKTNFGEAIMDKLGPSLKNFVDTLNNAHTAEALNNLGSMLGTVGAGFIDVFTKIVQAVSSASNAITNAFNSLPDWLKRSVAGTAAFAVGGTAGGVSGLIGGGITGASIGMMLGGVPGAAAGGLIGAGIGGGAGLLGGGFGLETLTLLGMNNVDVENIPQNKMLQEILKQRGIDINSDQGKAMAKQFDKNMIKGASLRGLMQPQILDLLRRSGTKQFQTIEEMSEATPEAQVGLARQAATAAMNLLGTKQEGSQFAAADLFQANKNIITGLGNMDRQNFESASTIQGQLGAFRYANFNERLMRAQGNVTVAQQTGNRELTVQAGRDLESEKKKIQNETQAAAQAATSFIGLAKSVNTLQATFDNLSNQGIAAKSSLKELEARQKDLGDHYKVMALEGKERIAEAARQFIAKNGEENLTLELQNALEKAGVNSFRYLGPDAGNDLFSKIDQAQIGGADLLKTISENTEDRIGNNYIGQRAQNAMAIRNQQAVIDNLPLDAAQTGIDLQASKAKLNQMGGLNFGGLSASFKDIADTLKTIAGGVDATKIGDAVGKAVTSEMKSQFQGNGE